VLQRYADPRALLKAGRARLIALIVKASLNHQGQARAQQWLDAARAAVDLYGDHPAVAYGDLAAEVVTEIRLLRAIQAELGGHAAEREACYRWVDIGTLTRSLPGLGAVGAPVLVATMARPGRFHNSAHFKSFTGLAPRASETGNTDRTGQPMSKAGPVLLRATLIRAADHGRKQDPQLAKIYYTQMVERGADHLKALCVVAGHLAERAWTVMNRAMPYVVCDTDGTAVNPEQAEQIIAEQWTVPPHVRTRRRSTKARAEKAPQQVPTGHQRSDAQGVDKRGDLPRKRSSAARQHPVKPSTLTAHPR
jgi:transposase